MSESPEKELKADAPEGEKVDVCVCVCIYIEGMIVSNKTHIDHT